ncbi:hypothetical protein CCP3SC1_60065 [Gammaproteobacteria bacterium]
MNVRGAYHYLLIHVAAYKLKLTIIPVLCVEMAA